MSIMNRGLRLLLWGMAVSGLVGLSSQAIAANLGGDGVVLAKSVAAGTLTLDGPIVLHVDEKTKILGEDGQRITLAEVPAAEKVDSLFAVTGSEGVRYEAVRRGKNLVAVWIRVTGSVTQ